MQITDFEHHFFRIDVGFLYFLERTVSSSNQSPPWQGVLCIGSFDKQKEDGMKTSGLGRRVFLLMTLMGMGRVNMFAYMNGFKSMGSII